MIEAAGPAAERYARTLADDPARTILVVDPAMPAPAFARAVALRRAGTPFDTALALEEPRALVARALADLILQQVPDYDARRLAFDQLAEERLPLGNVVQAQMRPFDDRQLATLRDLLRLGDAVAVRSWREDERLGRVLGRRFRTRLVAPACARVPAAAARRGATTVIWAADARAADAVLLAFALEEELAPAAIVAQGNLAGLRAVVFAPERAHEALVDAGVVVVAGDDPAAAVAFARAGYCTAVSSTSGANEFLEGAVRFDPWDRRSVSDAVARARGEGAPRVRDEAFPAHGAASPAAAAMSGGLVSVVIPAYRRFDDLRVALSSLQRQTYPHVEAIVVDDAGPHPVEIAAAVAAFPFARLSVHARNADRAQACNTGLALARGAYVGFLDEDDELFPDHVARLVEALERTGLDVAHADVLTQFLEPAGGALRAYGYAIEMEASLERSTFLGTNQFGYLSVLFRRGLLERIGALDPAMGICNDYEIVLRAAQHGEFAHVPRVTALYTRRDDDSNMTTIRGDRYVSAHEALFARYPVHGRPSIERQRSAAVAHFRALGGIGKPQPPLRLL